MKLRNELITALLAVLLLTIVLGLAYPLAMTAVGQVAFPARANGSQVESGGRVVGSKLIAHPLKGAGYFQPRPSQTDYSATATAFSNRGPDSAAARFFYRDQLRAYLRREGRYTPGLAADRVPVDAATTSASGIDPQISERNAAIQARRVAAVRQLAPARVRALIAAHTAGRFAGIFGEPGVNVLELNLALDQEASR